MNSNLVFWHIYVKTPCWDTLLDMVTLKVNQKLIIIILLVTWRDAFVQFEQAHDIIVRLALCGHVLL